MFNYLYCLEMAFNEGTIPGHNSDIPYVFHNAEYLEAFYIPGISEKVQDIVCGTYVNFARNGDPNGEGIPVWEPVVGDNGATMLYDEESQCLCGHDRELLPLIPASRFFAPAKKK